MGQVSHNRNRKSWILGILLSLVTTNAIIAISLMISSRLAWGLAIASSIMLGLLLTAAGMVYRRWILCWAALIAIIASVLGGMYMRDFADISTRQIHEGVTISEASDYPEAGGFTFTEGLVRRDMESTYIEENRNNRGQTSRSHYIAAPLVSESWSPGDPVRLFVVAQTSRETENWQQPWRAAIRAAATFTEQFEKAADVCRRENGLEVISPVLMLHWVESPQKAISAINDAAREVILFWNIVMLSGILLTWIIQTVRHQKTPPEMNEKITALEQKPTETSVIIRFFYVFTCFYLMLFALYFAGINLNALQNILLITIAAIFYVIASVTLQIIHHRRNGHPADLLLAAAYPFFLYMISFRSFDYTSGQLWMFVGFSSFFIQTGGFILGILLAPVFGWKGLHSGKDVKETVTTGLKFMALLRGRAFFSLMLLGLWAALLSSLKLIARPGDPATAIDHVLFAVFLFLGVALVTRLTYHSSIVHRR